MKLINVSNNVDEIYNLTKIILKEMIKDEPIRLVGVSINKMVSNNHYQINMFENIENKELDYKLNKVIDKINKTYKDKVSIGIK